MMQRTFGLVLVAGILLLFTKVISPAPCWLVFVLVGIISFPIWQYRTEYLLFRRRLVLSGAIQSQSRIRIFLWKGGVTKVIQVAVSMFMAWVLLVLVTELSTKHSSVLVVDGLFLSMIVGPVTRHLRGDIKALHLRVIARRWPLLLINVIVLASVIMMIDFFSVGAEDTRHMDWALVAEQAFVHSFNEANCILWGLSTGGVSAVEALSWHLSELVIPNVPGMFTKYIAWFIFLLRDATLAWLYTALLLGASVFIDKLQEGHEGNAAGSTASRSFYLTIVILALPFIYASVKLSAVNPEEVKKGVSRLADSINPCKPNEASRARLVMKLDKKILNERQQVINDIDSTIDQGLDRIFADVESGVDLYLDWYFTVIGEYQRLAAVITADVDTAMNEKLEEYLFTQSDFEAQLDHLDSMAEHLITDRFASMVSTLNIELDFASCDIGRLDFTPLNQLDKDKLRASAAAVSGVGAGIVTSKALAKKAAGVVVGKLAAKKSIQTGAAIASKALTKKGTSAVLSAGVGATVCAPAGPMAILCGFTAGVVTWFAVDKILIEVDEAINREKMRTDILNILEEQKAELKVQLKQKNHTTIDNMAAQANVAVQRSFIPYKDGMHP